MADKKRPVRQRNTRLSVEDQHGDRVTRTFTNRQTHPRVRHWNDERPLASRPTRSSCSGRKRPSTKTDTGDRERKRQAQTATIQEPVTGTTPEDSHPVQHDLIPAEENVNPPSPSTASSDLHRSTPSCRHATDHVTLTPIPPITSRPHTFMQKNHIECGLTPGRVISFSGTPTGSCNKFNIDLKYEAGASSDYFFHFNPRFDESPNVVVRNSRFCGAWGPEERCQPEFPFKQGQHFNICIILEESCLKVTVNGKHFCDYKYRRPNLNKVPWIEVCGGISGVTVDVY